MIVFFISIIIPSWIKLLNIPAFQERTGRFRLSSPVFHEGFVVKPASRGKPRIGYTIRLNRYVSKIMVGRMAPDFSEKERGGQRSERPAPEIELLVTNGGVRTVDSPVRIKILSLLRDRELSFHEIVRETNKAKSTVSAHLKFLLHEGIIGEKPDLADSRRKIFYIKSRHLGDLSSVIRWSDDVYDGMSSAFMKNDDPYEFYRLMLHSIRVSLISQGVNIDPILREAGFRVGDGIYEIVADPDISRFLGNLGNFWTRHKLGRLQVEHLAPVTICVYDCFECGDLPITGRPACAFDSGMLDALFSRHFRGEHKAAELRCYAMGDDHCRFVIRPVNRGEAGTIANLVPG
jgi:uncharacterized protein